MIICGTWCEKMSACVESIKLTLQAALIWSYCNKPHLELLQPVPKTILDVIRNLFREVCLTLPECSMWSSPKKLQRQQFIKIRFQSQAHSKHTWSQVKKITYANLNKVTRIPQIASTQVVFFSFIHHFRLCWLRAAWMCFVVVGVSFIRLRLFSCCLIYLLFSFSDNLICDKLH